jgi:hypothetical protein
MKNLQIVSPLLTSLLLGSVALAQANNPPEAPQPQNSASTQIQSTQIHSTEATAPESARPSNDHTLVSQARPYPRFPRGPMGPPRGRAYPSAFAPPRPPALSPLGALIGFGVGGALAAAGSQDQTARGRIAVGLFGGGLCALIGGAIGHSFSAIHSHNFDQWDDARNKRRDVNAPHPSDPDEQASSAPAQTPSASVGSL